MWTAPIELLSDDDQPRKSRRHAAGFTQGFMISASNPKVILFYIAFLPTFMDVTALSSGDIAIACLLTLIALMAGLMLIAVTASKARAYFKSERSVKRLNRGAGSIMMGAGAFLITSDWEEAAKQLSSSKNGDPYGIRTRVAAVKGRCPRPLDEGVVAAKAIRYTAPPSKSSLEMSILHFFFKVACMDTQVLWE